MKHPNLLEKKIWFYFPRVQEGASKPFLHNIFLGECPQTPHPLWGDTPRTPHLLEACGLYARSSRLGPSRFMNTPGAAPFGAAPIAAWPSARLNIDAPLFNFFPGENPGAQSIYIFHNR